MSHAHKADKLLIKPAAGARPAPPRARTVHSEGTPTAASPPTSHTRHGDTTLAVDPDRPTRRVSQSPDLGENLDVPVRAVQPDPLPVLDQPGCMLDSDDGR
jgi:hypothetical protein